MELPLKTLVSSAYKLCGMQAKYKTCLLWLKCHFTAMPTLALLLAIAAVTSLLCNLQKHSDVLPSNVFHFHMLFTVLNSENL